MKSKKIIFLFMLLFIILLSLPDPALAQFDDYGYNSEGRLYQGTLDNWEAFLRGGPPSDNQNETDTIFINRKWDRMFDPVIYGGMPLGTGAWQKAELWQHLSGGLEGWTWHLKLEVVYSPDTPISGAIILNPEEIGGTGFYGVGYKEWLEGPRNERIDIENLSINRSVIQKALHF